MGEPTYSLATLRRAICRELQMPFMRRFKNGYLAADSGTTTSLVDSELSQKDKYWSNDWVYRIASQEVSRIVNFNATENKLYLEVPITAFAAADQYEIHSVWNANDIHEAINQAIRDIRRIFIDTVTDETLIVEEDKLEYTISGLTKVPFRIAKVFVEQPTSCTRGTATAADATHITLQTGHGTGVTTSYKVSIYGGTGTGQLRAVTGVAGDQLTVAAWTVQPDTTSKYAVWNPTNQTYDWTPWQALRFDAGEYPNVMYLSARPTDFYGMRIRLEYTAHPSELSAEADTTIIPESYLMPAAISILHGRMVGDNKTDRDLHFAESRRYKEQAMTWLVQNAPHQPSATLSYQHGGSYQPPTDNPLDWP